MGDKSEDTKVEPKTEEKKDESKTEEKKDESKEDESKKTSGGLFSFFSKGDKTDEKAEKKEDDKKTEEKNATEKKVDEVKAEEKKLDEKKIQEKKTEDKKMEVDKDDDIVEIKKPEVKPVQSEEMNLIPLLEKVVTYLKWDQTDATYYLKEIRGQLIMSQAVQNEALTQMLQSFVDKQTKVTPPPATTKIGPRSATTRGSSPHAPQSHS